MFDSNRVEFTVDYIVNAFRAANIASGSKYVTVRFTESSLIYTKAMAKRTDRFIKAIRSVEPEYGMYMPYSATIEESHPTGSGAIANAFLAMKDGVEKRFAYSVQRAALAYARGSSMRDAKASVEDAWVDALKPAVDYIRSSPPSPVDYGYHVGTANLFMQHIKDSWLEGYQRRLMAYRDTDRREDDRNIYLAAHRAHRLASAMKPRL